MKKIQIHFPFSQSLPFMLALGILTLFSSCSKDDDGIAPEQLLAGNNSKTWQIERVSSLGVADSPQPCSADDEFTFYTNREFLYDDKELKCNQNSPNMIEGTWELNNESNTLSISAGPLAGSADVLELSANRLRITTDEAGVPVTITFRPK